MQTLSDLSPQALLDYRNDAHTRVCVDTRCLQKRTTITVPAGTASVALPADFVRVLGVSIGQTLCVSLTSDEALRLLSGDTSQLLTDSQFYYVLGGEIGFIKPPLADIDVVFYYQARPEPLSDPDVLETNGDYSRLVERLANSYLLEDDGQTEVAQAETTFYMAEAARLTRRDRYEQRQRIAALGIEFDL